MAFFIYESNRYYNDGLYTDMVKMIADTVGDLPTDGVYMIGSVAHVIDTNSEYMLNSNHEWKQQTSATDYYTRDQIDALLMKDDYPTQGSDNFARSGGILTLMYGRSPYTIDSGTDLDTMIQPNVYRCSTSAIAQTLTHCPVSVGFRLEVKSTIGSAAQGYQVQHLFPNDASGAFYYRRRTSSSWGGWFKFQGVAV